MKEINGFLDKLSEFPGESRSEETIEKTDLMPQEPSPPQDAYETVKIESSSALNCKLDIGTFTTTHIERYASRIFSEASNIDFASPEAQRNSRHIAQKVLNILGDLWNCPEKGDVTGLPTSGSSEAGMIAGTTALKRWKIKSLDNSNEQTPNFIVSEARHPMWDKFARLLDVEIRTIPIEEDTRTLDLELAVNAIDKNTFMIVANAGDYIRGLNDDIQALDQMLTQYNKRNDTSVPIHVDAAIGGFINPFIYPEFKWDFRTENVVSINVSSHKFGLVYPGLGWLVWRSSEEAMAEIGGLQDGINDTRPASHIFAQYYQILRLGFEGYRAVADVCIDVAEYAHEKICGLDRFQMLSDRVESPFFSWSLREDTGWKLSDLQAQLKQRGWIINLIEAHDGECVKDVMRVVFRRDMGISIADRLIEDISDSVKELEGKISLAAAG